MGRPVSGYCYCSGASYGVSGPALLRRRLWDRRTVLGILATLVVALAIGSGIWWMVGGDAYLASFGLLAWHIIFGFALVGIVVLHMSWHALTGCGFAMCAGAVRRWVLGRWSWVPLRSGRRNRCSCACSVCPERRNVSPVHASQVASPAMPSLRQAGLPTSLVPSTQIPGISPSLAPRSRPLSPSPIRTR